MTAEPKGLLSVKAAKRDRQARRFAAAWLRERGWCDAYRTAGKELAQTASALIENEARLRSAGVLLGDVVDWLVATDFPYDWSTSAPAPAGLRALLAEAYAARDGESVEDWLAGLRDEQAWSDDA